MRTIDERRHFDTVAVQHQLRIATKLTDVDFHSDVVRQPHRLHKVNAVTIQDGRGSSNPRRWAVRTKDRLTPGELSENERFSVIESADLDDISRIRSLDRDAWHESRCCALDFC